MIVSLWNLTGVSAAALARCLSIFTAIGKVWTQISWLRDCTRSCRKTPVRLVNRGPDVVKTRALINDTHTSIMDELKNICVRNMWAIHSVNFWRQCVYEPANFEWLYFLLYWNYSKLHFRILQIHTEKSISHRVFVTNLLQILVVWCWCRVFFVKTLFFTIFHQKRKRVSWYRFLFLKKF